MKESISILNGEERRFAAESLAHLTPIHEAMVRVEAPENHGVKLHPSWKKSAINLLQYLELRRHDIRPFQSKLSRLGLSSLGRAEGHVLAAVRAVMRSLHSLIAEPPPAQLLDPPTVSFEDGTRLLEVHTEALLGPPRGNPTRVMVTMPGEAAHDPSLVKALLGAGMSCMRINCAHDEPGSWKRMILHLRAAEKELGLNCRVLMDLAGPKLRTGEIDSPSALKVRPRRNLLGKVVEPSRSYLFSSRDMGPVPAASAHIPLPNAFLQRLQAGDSVSFTDTRGAARRLKVIRAEGRGFWAEARRTFYIMPGTQCRLLRPGIPGIVATAEVDATLSCDPQVTLRKGDTLLLTRTSKSQPPTTLPGRSRAKRPASIPCTLSAVFDAAKPGERIWFDDGKIGGIIRDVAPDAIQVEITQTNETIAKLRPDKGINLPDTDLHMEALTEDDLSHLPFVAAHADLIGMSFVERPDDLNELHRRLLDLGRTPGVILKIETQRAFEALPHLMLAAMQNPCAGVMIARGDLAVECGFERLAEVQEEILWLCEAAHMPVIWATQVLESLAKSGHPSRGEITDAAMGVRAECVMLNKGPHILEAMKSLVDILHRMQGHQRKKQTLLRELRSWRSPEGG